MKLPLIPWEQFSKTHFSIFFSIFVDMGYVYNHEVVNNPLNNEFLMSQGFSIDILSYYDKLIRFEYSLNHVGETRKKQYLIFWGKSIKHGVSIFF